MTNDEANELLTELQDQQMERANEVLDELQQEEAHLELGQEAEAKPPRDPVFKHEKGPMTFGSIDK